MVNKSFIGTLLAMLVFSSTMAQEKTVPFNVNYNPAIQPTHQMQYFKPVEEDLFVGDCIPFFHQGTYYLYWLIDKGHHSSLNGLGGHQWVVSTSTDLINWKNYPIALGIDEDWEKSICTGSVAYYNKKFYAFYATRLINSEGKVNEQLSYAISTDGIHFKKQKPNPFYTYAPGYSQRNFRDPKVTIDSMGYFHLFVSSATDSGMRNSRGALVHLVSRDLKQWEIKKPLIINQDDVPECPDYFHWNNWYYLIYGRGGNTFYLKSTAPYGPWQYPASQALNEDWANVVKTAEFTNGRRIAAGWIPSRKGAVDNGNEIFGGNVVLREVIQDEDGTLQTKFPAEVIPATARGVDLKITGDTLTKQLNNDTFSILSPNGEGSAWFSHIPADCRITLEIETLGDIEEYGLYLRSSDGGNSGYKLGFSPDNNMVTLGNTSISAVHNLNNTVKIDIIMKGSIIDVCVDDRRCIVNRCYEQKGNKLWIYARHGNVLFKSVRIAELK
jgi:beta-fructofuranosidase